MNHLVKVCCPLKQRVVLVLQVRYFDKSEIKQCMICVHVTGLLTFMKLVIAIIFRYSFGQRIDSGLRCQLFTESYFSWLCNKNKLVKKGCSVFLSFLKETLFLKTLQGSPIKQSKPLQRKKWCSMNVRK